jgi:hypothetical protein
VRTVEPGDGYLILSDVVVKEIDATVENQSGYFSAPGGIDPGRGAAPLIKPSIWEP